MPVFTELSLVQLVFSLPSKRERDRCRPLMDELNGSALESLSLWGRKLPLLRLQRKNSLPLGGRMEKQPRAAVRHDTTRS